MEYVQYGPVCSLHAPSSWAFCNQHDRPLVTVGNAVAHIILTTWEIETTGQEHRGRKGSKESKK